MAFDQGLVDWVIEAMEPVGKVTMRRMMGVATLYFQDRIFATVDDEAIWFKADAVSNPIWEEAGCDRFSFESGGKIEHMNYRRAPDDAYDDADALRRWAGLAIEAGQRAPAKRPKKKG